MSLPGFMGNRGTMSFISGEQKSKNEGNRGKIKILILGNKGKCCNISGERGNRYPTWEGLQNSFSAIQRAVSYPDKATRPGQKLWAFNWHDLQLPRKMLMMMILCFTSLST